MKPSKDKDQKETELEEKINYCEECEVPTENYNIAFRTRFYICEECQEHLFCECGNELGEHAGEGFCPSCR